MANINGWGRGTWGQLTFGEALPVIITAPGAATVATSGVAVDAGGQIGINGVVGTTGAPVAGVNGKAIVSVPGIVGSVGSLSVTIDGEANVTPTGQVGTSAVGTPTTISNNNLSVTLNQAVASVGNPVIIAKAVVTIPDDEVAGLITFRPYANVWSLIPSNQDPGWGATPDTSQYPNWSDVA